MNAPLVGVAELENVDPEERELFAALRAATLGDYDIYSPLGRGGMASVFLALDLSLNRSVAIKVISPSALTSGTLVERFWLEARTAASLSHPHVIPIYAVKSVAGLHFFVMKYVEGGSLDSVLKTGGKLSISLVRTILTQVSSALAYAHRRGVIHRDVKPANIMLDDEGFAIVMDFGIAKVRDVTALTTAGTMVGTPYYMSPEQFSEKEIDGRSDQYSLGVVAFELLTGKRPFSGETLAQILRGHLLDSPPDVRDLRPDCPPELAAAVSRMLSKEPNERFPSLESVTTLLASMPTVDADHVREQLMSLARTASLSRPRISQPLSPVPLSSSRIAAVTAPSHSGTRLPATPAGVMALVRGRMVMSSLVVLVLLAFSGALVVRQRAGGSKIGKQPVAPPPSPQVLGPNARVVGPGQSALATTGRRSGDSSAKLSALGDEPRSGAPAKPSSPALRQLDTKERSTAAKPVSKASNASVQQSVADSKSAGGLSSPVDPTSQKTVAPDAGLPAPPVAKPQPVAPATFRIGSHLERSFLYIDGHQIGPLPRLEWFQHAPGQIRLQLKAEECVPWDTIIFLNPGDTARIGWRIPTCSR